MTTDTDQALVERASHDPQAFRQLYGLYFPRLYAYISYRVGRVQDAEDLTAAVFLRVVEELGRFQWRHDQSFAAWLFRIAHNLVSNFHRDNRSTAASTLPLEDLPDIPSNALLPGDLVERKEAFRHLRSLVDELPPRRREAITLKYFGGLQNREIAAVLGLDERTVASNLSRALDDLQSKYNAEAMLRE
ncbi:MAG: RNA polymerase sigma factor [Chloroflexia bacterium]